ncbi:carbohydrate ABC transporter permease [Microbacterium azadirachtae]|uniref:L-arabinose transport system permease protein AraQ n=1 Tax=Microbacterium azadirachtae TaxID=582680 RepID=A0A0F0LR25_9MICO|nr:carbohydrate ABC transporter permease [Microbacterium azadirachtae]KJL35154.1 L-arabinose transport system permease protein AraQ [Microbacterium azadirachtae]
MSRRYGQKTPNAGRRTPASTLFLCLTWIAIAGFVVFFIIPVLWLLLTPSKTDAELVRSAPLAFGSFEGYLNAFANLLRFEDGAIVTWAKNSVVYSALALILTVMACIPAGYGLAMTKFRGRKTLLNLTLLVMLMPGTTLVLPVFLELNAIHLTGTIWSVVIPSAFYPFGVYLTYIYYSTSLPPDLLSAARIDGASEAQIFFQIALPLARPIVALVAFFSFVGTWNNYFLPLVMLAKTSDYPIPVGLQELFNNTERFNPTGGSIQLSIGRPELALAIIIGVLPVLLIFLFSQRSLQSGLLGGASKE